MTPQPPGADPSDRPSAEGPTDKELARQRAEAIVGRREHPTLDPSELVRPTTIKVGALMAWIGVVVLVYAGYRVINTKEGDITDNTSVDSLHALGWTMLVWAGLIIMFASLAYTGRKWAATALFVLAAIVAFYGAISLITAFAIEGVVTSIWSLSSSTLMRFREPSKDWFAALKEARSVNE